MRRALAVLLFVSAVGAACDHAPSGRSAGDGGDGGEAGDARGTDGRDASASDRDATPVDGDATGPTDAGRGATLPDGRCISGAFRRDGACTCQPGVPDICADSCVDLASDDGNCGVCGHVCSATSACAEGVCRAAPVVVAPANPGCQSIDLATSGGTLYWTDKGHGLVVSLAPGAAAPTTLASGEGAPTRLVARAGTSPAATTLFWVDETDKTVRRMAAAGGPPVTLATATTEMGGLTLSPDGASVYFATRPTIFRVPAAGGQAVPAVTDAYNDWAGVMAIVGNQMVFPTFLGQHVLSATLAENDVALCNKFDAQGTPDTTTCRRIGSSHEGTASGVIFSLGDRIFWANGSTIVGWPVAGQMLGEPIADTPTSETILGMAGASNTIYVADTAGVISRTPAVVGASPVPLARGQNQPRAVAVDDARVYWSTADCTIASLER
jgi:hypothetical protein